MVTASKRRPLVWRAASDKVAHAHELLRGPGSRRAATAERTLCGYRIVDVRLSWPPERRCSTCVAVAEAPIA
jgi:hypothetical protein